MLGVRWPEVKAAQESEALLQKGLSYEFDNNMVHF